MNSKESNEESLISIIVPIYNVEQYLEKCLESLIHQTYTKIEIILVDDGSTDESAKICDDWAEKDRRVIVFHQQNRGVSFARNVGIQAAKGDYLIFVDSDDYVSDTMCEVLYNIARKYDADMVMSDYIYIKSGEKIEGSLRSDVKVNVVNQEEAFRQITDLNYPAGVNAVTKLYKKKIAGKSRFKVDFPLGEDQEYVFSCLQDCKRVCITRQVLYYYVFRENSAVNGNTSIDEEKKYLELYTEIMKNFSFENSLKNRMLTFRIIQCELTIMKSMIMQKKIDGELLCELKKYIHDNMQSVVLSDYPLLPKMKIVLACYLFPIYKHIVRIKNRIR